MYGLETAQRGRPAVLLVAGLALSASLALISSPASAAAAVKCGGSVATIVGTNGDDVLEGTSGDDVIAGKDGDDTIDGKGGDDIICGGGGADAIVGGSGDDDLRGQGGVDRIDGGKGNDILLGGSGKDTLVGAGGSDEAKGGSGTDRCKAEAETSCEANPLDFDLTRFLINQAAPVADSKLSNAKRVPPVAKRAGLVRAFVGASNPAVDVVPLVKVYWRNNKDKGNFTLNDPSKLTKSPKVGKLKQTFNKEFGKSWLTATTEIYVIVDPANATFESNENNNRYPETGWVKLKAQNVPTFKVTMVPLRVNGSGINISTSKAKQWLDKTMRLFPISKSDVEVRNQFNFNTPNGSSPFDPNNWVEALYAVTDLWFAEGGDRFYPGIVGEDPCLGCGIGGIAWVGFYPVSINLPNYPDILAHELGHNMGLNHADCGGPAGVDPDFPDPNGKIDTWGYDVVDNETYDPKQFYDVLSYCSPVWISDYHYGLATEGRKAFGFYSDGVVATDESVMVFSGDIDSPPAHLQEETAVHVHGDGSVHDHGDASVRDHDGILGHADEKADPNSASASFRMAEKRTGVTPIPSRPGPYTLEGVDADGTAIAVFSFETHTAHDYNLMVHHEGFFFSVKVKNSVLDRVVEWQVHRNSNVLASMAS